MKHRFSFVGYGLTAVLDRAEMRLERVHLRLVSPVTRFERREVVPPPRPRRPIRPAEIHVGVPIDVVQEVIDCAQPEFEDHSTRIMGSHGKSKRYTMVVRRVYLG